MQQERERERVVIGHHVWATGEAVRQANLGAVVVVEIQTVCASACPVTERRVVRKETLRVVWRRTGWTETERRSTHNRTEGTRVVVCVGATWATWQRQGHEIV